MPELMPTNLPAWNLWSLLSRFERQAGFSGPSTITMTSMANFCEMYDLSQDDFEKIMFIEEIMYPTILKKIEDERGGK